MITKTYIRARLQVLITDRLYCMEHGEMNKTADLLAICTRLRNELEFHRLHGHNAHIAIVRGYAVDIWKLADTLGRKANLRKEIQDMVLQLTGHPTLHAVQYISNPKY